MHLTNHALVTGPNSRSGLFWFTISPLLTGDPAQASKLLYLNIERRGQPSVIIMSIKDYIDTIAPTPDWLEAIGAQAKKGG